MHNILWMVLHGVFRQNLDIWLEFWHTNQKQAKRLKSLALQNRNQMIIRIQRVQALLK